MEHQWIFHFDVIWEKDNKIIGLFCAEFGVGMMCLIQKLDLGNENVQRRGIAWRSNVKFSRKPQMSFFFRYMLYFFLEKWILIWKFYIVIKMIFNLFVIAEMFLTWKGWLKDKIRENYLLLFWIWICLLVCCG